ncbi:hypothetical protein JAAARDRAFT_81797 [Jaapia argillacea MUCL 33604]|uniref:RING-type E3 ubiquitin transferase n=1 Tax=Jaapia argillacea MUCL 33604 TaxID=933084 RepID=A0A067P7J3_9AGAM|nr:hypothetical protein JAAARDRAFT_81797 [Jaapia argillacea MUCL 33604]
MQQEEQDTCRICSAPAEPDQPLFHPCKCSGTIRYIHQDCLTTWLAHSKKKTCDVCKHPYSFTKVYAQDMPARLPPVLLIRRLAQQLFFALLFCVRAVVVGTIWLALLPYVTLWTWRMYFAMGDSTAWWISDRPRPPSSYPRPMFHHLKAPLRANTSMNTNGSYVNQLLDHPTWRALSSDIFAGQIIACLIVLAFVAMFLLREWILQNAGPEMLEVRGEEVRGQEAEPQPAPPQDPAPPVLVPLPDVEPDPEQAAAVEEVGDDAGFAHESLDDSHLWVDSESEVEPHEHEEDSSDRERRGKGKRVDYGEPSAKRKRQSRRPHFRNQDSLIGPSITFSDREEGRRPVGRFRHPNPDRFLLKRPEGEGTSSASSSTSSLAVPEKAEFTFRSPLQMPTSTSLVQRRSFSEPRMVIQPPTPGSSDALPGVRGYAVGRDGRLDLRMAFMDQPKYRDILPSIDAEEVRKRQREWSERQQDALVAGSSTERPSTGTQTSPSLFSFAPSDPSVHERTFSSKPPTPLPFPLSPSLPDNIASAGPSTPRRPPLPSVTLPATSAGSSPLALHLSPSGSVAPSSSKAVSPLASPNLATYQAPEELEAGPSNLNSVDYFGEDIRQPDMEEEHRHYFRDPEEEEEEEEDAEDDGNVLGEYPYPTSPASGLESDDEDELDVEAMRMEMMEVEILENDDDHEGREIDGNRLAPIRDEVAPVVPPQDQPGGPEANEEADADVQDDMDGAMEAIGMRGPIYGIIQNAALMIFILDTTIGLGVWLPFTIGKSTALLSLDPPRFLQLLHMPIRAMRILTDPVVDLTMYLLDRFLFSPVLFATRMVGSRLMEPILLLVRAAFGHQLTDRLLEGLTRFTTPSEVHQAVDSNSFSLVPSDGLSINTTLTSLLHRVLDSDSKYIRLAEPHFAALGRWVRFSSSRFSSTWTRLALGSDIPDRVFAIGLGYVVVGFGLAVYLNVLTVGSVQNAGRAVRNVVREQLLVAKMAAFITIELVIFPLGCGIILDLYTIWLFPDTTLDTRIAFFRYAPLTATFYHWVAGTMFMYQFAVFLTGCRGIMRPGAMWFIKDPQDHNYHPIRDILERPSFSQLRKLVVSATVYAMVIACGVATVSATMRLISGTIFPLRWKLRQPLSEVPIDLLFLHLVLPYTLHYFRPSKTIRKVTVHVWKVVAAELRLTSCMFGGRYLAEEATPTHWRVPFFTSRGDLLETDVTKDGSFKRVPADDNVALTREMQATADVDEHGEPLNEVAARMIAAQNAETERAKRNVKEDFTVVYMPPKFSYRVATFILVIWLAVCTVLASLVTFPIEFGRLFFKLFTSKEVHDGYSFLAGFYLLWACYLVGYATDRLDKRRQRRGVRPRAEWPVYLVKRTLLWTAKISYMVTFLGLVIPVLISLLVETYLILPFRYTVNPSLVPRIRIVDMWALGLVYAKIALRAQRGPAHNNTVFRGLNNITRNGWTHPDPVKATREVIIPVVCALLAALLLPAGSVWLVRNTLNLPLDDKVLFLHVYPGIFALVGIFRLLKSSFGMLSIWSQSVRDTEFLVEMRLQNLESRKREDGDSGTPVEVVV